MNGYVILEHSDTGEMTDESKLDFVGFAKSRHAAEKAIREDVKDNFAPDNINDNFDDYASRYLICEIAGEIKPIPSVTVQIKLKSV